MAQRQLTNMKQIQKRSGSSLRSRIWAGVVILLVIAACRGTFDIGLEPSAASPTPPATPTPLPSSPTASPAATPATPLPPSPTPPGTAPTPTLYPQGNIVMAPGATAAVAQGTLQPGQVVTYMLSAGQSQPMILIMSSPNNDVTLGLYEPDGTMLLNPADKVTHWQGLLPRTEMYTIWVTGGATAENFNLTVKVAQVVNFAPGATSATLNDTTVNGYVYSYSLSGAAGQTMSVSLNVPSSTAYLDIFGLVSGTLLSFSAKDNTWTGILPQTQDYIVEVIPNAGQEVNYSLTVSIGTTAGNILFTTGTTAAVVQGTVGPGQIITYTLNAGQSQPLILITNSPDSDVTLGVFEADGHALLDPANRWTRWQDLLPTTEIYTIQVIGGATMEDYTLTAKAAQVVNFAAGATSVTLSGTTLNGYVISYGLSCSANQTMTVSLNVSSSTAYLDIFGLSAGRLLNPSVKANSWTGILPQTQDYIIEVIPNAGQVVDYSVTISVH
ncbi:MAG: hypothetical protein WCE68_08490 [Anaerolineales bacterium]